MVVGSVQSGKTANYVSLINKAADYGYKIIIVITGIHENLRRQTQNRIVKVLSVSKWIQNLGKVKKLEWENMEGELPSCLFFKGI